MDSSSSTTKGDARLIKLTVGEAQSIMRAFNRVVDQRGNVDVDVFQRQNKKVKALLQSKVDAIDDLDKRKEDKIEAMTFSNDDSGIDLGEDTGGSQSPGITDSVIHTARKVVKISAPVSKDDRHVDGAKADAVSICLFRSYIASNSFGRLLAPPLSQLLRCTHATRLALP